LVTLWGSGTYASFGYCFGPVDPFGLCGERTWWEKLERGYYFGTGYGEDALGFYTRKWSETGNWWWLVGGGFSALWTPETYQATAWTLITAAQFNNAHIKPHYSQVQYYPKNNPSYTSKWSTRGSKTNLPHHLGDDARKALSLPNYNTADAARNVKVNPFKFLLGPRPVSGGIGTEYFRGWRWP